MHNKMYVLFIILFFIPLYNKNPEDWRNILGFSILLATCLSILIFIRGLSAEYITESLKQGNAYRFLN